MAETLASETVVREFVLEARDFERVAALIHARAGIALSDYKRDMVYSRLTRRLRDTRQRNFGAYLDLLEREPECEEWEHFVNALTTNLTAFFRENHHFEELATLLRARSPAPSTLWCNAASTGEEPYSIAITACEAYGTLTPPVRILATDIDTQVLATAAQGVYTMDRVSHLAPERLKAYFQRGSGPNAGHVRVRKELRDLVSFRPLNLLDDHYGLRGGFDAVFCRNVMIYFDKPTQRHVLERVLPLLAPDAPMFAGHSEVFTHAADLVAPCGRTVYRAVK